MSGDELPQQVQALQRDVPDRPTGVAPDQAVDLGAAGSHSGHGLAAAAPGRPPANPMLLEQHDAVAAFS